jgi:hypothetical protein
MQMLSRDEAERRVRDRAVADPAFRAQLKENPKGAIAAEFGTEVPDFINVHVHEESASELHLVIPATEAELTDEQLEAISGAGDYWSDMAGSADAP